MREKALFSGSFRLGIRSFPRRVCGVCIFRESFEAFGTIGEIANFWLKGKKRMRFYKVRGSLEILSNDLGWILKCALRILE